MNTTKKSTIKNNGNSMVERAAPPRMLEGQDGLDAMGLLPQSVIGMQIRVGLSNQLKEILKTLGLSKDQSAAAARLGVSQPRVSDLLRGRLEKFSSEKLMLMIYRVGGEITVTVKPPHQDMVAGESNVFQIK
jgi:predicted XRE-type DNA-binding protein